MRLREAHRHHPRESRKDADLKDLSIYASKRNKNTKRRKHAFSEHGKDQQRLRYRWLAICEIVQPLALAWDLRHDLCDWPDEGDGVPDFQRAKEWWMEFQGSENPDRRVIPDDFRQTMNKRYEAYKKSLHLQFLRENVNANKELLRQAKAGELDAKYVPVLAHTKDAVWVQKKDDVKGQMVFAGGLTINAGSQPRRLRQPKVKVENVIDVTPKELPIASDG